jgi:hypothetical protein
MKSDCTDMIFIDNDLSFENDAMITLLKLPCQVVGAAYPYRADQDGYPVDMCLDENKLPIGNKELGLIECKHVPTGLMRIRRDALDKFQKEYPKIKDKAGMYHYFRNGLLYLDGEGDENYYGEDVYFCMQCRKIGIKVWCYPKMTLAHIGTFGKIGNYHEYLLGNEKREKVVNGSIST